MEKLLSQLQQNPFVLAPMAGITDHAFRSFMKELGASVVITELVSASGLKYGSDRTFKLMSYGLDQRPVGIQLFGEEPEVLATAAQIAEEKGADFVDLNFGCPVPKVVKKGGGSAILKDLVQLKIVVSTVKRAIRIPLTIKIRTGWDASSRNAAQVCHIAYNEGVTWVAIHGRTRAQGYSGEADWNYIAEVKKQSKIPVLGNGDIHSGLQAVNRLKESGCDGVLIGRGCLKNPYIFLEALRIWQGKQGKSIEQSLWQAYTRLKDQLSSQCDEYLVQLQLKKFAAWFSSGYPDCAQFRKKIFQSKTIDETMGLAREFFISIEQVAPVDTSSEGFLMGGHG